MNFSVLAKIQHTICAWSSCDEDCIASQADDRHPRHCWKLALMIEKVFDEATKNARAI